ncbi:MULTISPECIES: type I polyketide synthase [unclassified Ruegeria]|uniref:type I polyketide synthase n=1 Tax=unclassified Ruegeria TaxID=2625375 RepID=UPI001489D80D|nr:MULTISPECIES: type I polyketide synthase [unclassified Ruegeria]
MSNDATGSFDNRIAIIGRAGRFSGAPDIDAFWKLLSEGRTGAARLSDADLLARGVTRKELADPNYVKVAHILPDMENFDAGFFGFSPREASILDPQHRHFLQCGWEVLEDAGWMPESFDGRIGVYAGSGMQSYLPFNLLSNPDLVEEIGMFLLRHTGNDKDFLTTRLSYLLNLTGPSVAVQTACSTSLVAVHLACGALMNIECDMALAGGVTIELPHRVGYGFSPGEILSPDGVCRAFDDDSQGTVFGSGAAVLALRRYEDAVRDGDDIKAVILGTAINNDGVGKASYLAPSVDGQAEAAAEALALAGLEPGDVDYIEAHGTGTPIGDPIELTALQDVYSGVQAGSIGIGSVKTNIGHTDTAAGAASLIKVVESLTHERLPASLNFNTPNSRFDFVRSPFQVEARGRDWPRGQRVRRAAVNSLGVGGTNAHVVVEEAPAQQQTQEDNQWRLFPFSARKDGALSALREKWVDYLSDHSPASPDIATTLRDGRRAFAERFVVAARNPSELRSVLQAKAHPLGATGKSTEGDTTPEIVFLFPGGGAQYPGAGAEMRTSSVVFDAAVHECLNALPADAPADLEEMMFARDRSDAEASAKLSRSDYAIPALFILEYAYARLWDSWGVKPDVIFAHSVGEYAAAVIAGTMQLGDALKIVTLRGQVMEAAPEGAMTTVPFNEADTAEFIQRTGAELDIAALNLPDRTVVSGPLQAIERLEDELAKQDHEVRRIHIAVAAHSRQLDGQLDRFRAGFEGVTFAEPKIPVMSSLRGAPAQSSDLASADYWVQHLRHTVRFTDATKEALSAPGRIVIEVGPGQTLGPLVEAMELPHKPRAMVYSAPSVREPRDEFGVMLTAFGALWANGCDVEWDKAVPKGGRRISLPTYAFDKTRHWIEPGRGKADADDQGPLTLPRIAQMDDWFETIEWAPTPVASLGATTIDGSPWLVFAGSDTLSRAVVKDLSRAGAETTVITVGSAFAKTEDGYQLRPNAVEEFDALLAEIGQALPARILMLWPLADTSTTAFDSTVLLARLLQQADTGATRLVVAARGATGPDTRDPELALLAGVIRSAPREVPELEAVLVDLDAQASEPAAIATDARRILDEALSTSPEDQVAWRGDVRLTRKRVSSPMPTQTVESRIQPGGTWLITGGTGGIGRQFGRWLGETYQAKIGLLSRSAHEDEALARQIRAAGGDVMFLKTDVTDKDAMAAAIAYLQSSFGPVRGVLHAAGVLDDGPLSVKSLDELHAVIAPKVKGAQILDELLPDGSLDAFAVVSSTSVETGPAGQVGYVGANAALEALAARRSDGLSLAWGAWRDSGMAARVFGHAGFEAETDRHPLLRHRRSEDSGEVIFERLMHPEEDWEIADHVVAGLPVLPGTAFIELGQSAAKEVLQSSPFEISALSFNQPMVFAENLPRLMRVTLTPIQDGFELKISSMLSTSDPAEDHVQMQILTKRKADKALPHGFDAIPAMSPIADADLVKQDDVIGFGPRWDTVGPARRAGNWCEGQFTLPEAYLADLSTHPLHPGLLDMAATVGLNGLQRDATAPLYAPMSVARIRVFAPLSQAITAQSVKVAETRGQFAAFDVVIRDSAGAVLMIFEHLALRALSQEALSTAPAPAQLGNQLLATGIRDSEADALFTQIFSHPSRHQIISPVSLDLVKLMMVEARPKPKARAKSDNASKSKLGPHSAKMAEIWEDILGAPDLQPEDDFFDLGGHSLNAVRLFTRIRQEFDVGLPLATLFETPTLGALTALVLQTAGLSEDEDVPTPSLATSWSPLVQITKGDEKSRPLFCIHGAGGNILNFRPLAGFLDPSIPFFGLRALGSDGGAEVDATIEEMAARYITAIRERYGKGPYRLAGYSGGGVVAFEMVRQLRADGEDVDSLTFFDTIAPHMSQRPLSLGQKLWAARKWDLAYALDWMNRRRSGQENRDKLSEIKAILESGKPLPDELIGPRMTHCFVQAQNLYDTPKLDVDIHLFKARRASALFIAAGDDLGWGEYVQGQITTREFDCDHFTMMAEPAIALIGRELNQRLLGLEPEADEMGSVA